MDGLYDTELTVDVVGPRKMITIMSGGEELFSISETVVTGWLVIILLAIFFKVLTHNMKVKPESKRQVVAEWIVEFFNGLVKDNMGAPMAFFAPYICTIFCFAAFGSLVSVVGLRSMTADINCTGTWALFTFLLITYYKLKSNGVLGYLKGFTQPVIVIT
ncbi:MAG: F0F1 ATP synthase subunit A, partial [Oscillospiraceae bacterium]|nr:F0F1 ATP synthase subunit A [Oscillospiraceae bacterium]